MDFFFAAVVGWCGTGWPFPFPRGGGGGGLEPGDWGPPGCWVCGRLLGAIGGLVAVTLFHSQIGNSGIAGTAIVAFFGGSFLAEATAFIKNSMSKG